MEDTTATAAVETTTETAAAVSAPESSAASTPSERPTSMRDAMEKVLTKHAAEKTGTPTTEASATDQSLGEPASKKGPIPFDVHDTALKNAREKTRAEVMAEVEQQYAWAKNADRGAIAEAQRLGQMYTQDRAGFVRQILADAVNDPSLAPVVRSEAARLLAQGRGAASETAEPQLEMIPVQLEDGRVIQLATADSQMKREAWLRQQFLTEADQRAEQKYRPALSAAEKMQTAEEQTRAGQFAQMVDQELSALGGMDPVKHPENRQAVLKQVAEWCQQLPPEKANDPLVLDWLANRAWKQLVYPKLRQVEQAQSQAQTLASLKQKAVAQTESPSGAAPASVTKPRNPQQLAKFMAERSAATR